VGALRVRINPQVDPADKGRIERCLTLFEDYCVVTRSVRVGLDVSVDVQATAKTTSGVASSDRPQRFSIGT
jgi:hypothetical protein